MKKLMKIIGMMTTAALALGFASGCDADLDFGRGDDDYLRQMVIDNIYVNPDGWEEMWAGTGPGRQFLYLYADIPMKDEFTPFIMREGQFSTYHKSVDRDGVPFQEELGLTIFNEDGSGYRWSYTLDCEYAVGWLRITLKASDFERRLPDGRMNFRTVVQY